MATTDKKTEDKTPEVKLVDVTTTEPFMTNGKLLKPGKHSLPEADAEDLARRQREFDADQKRLLSNNGKTIDAMPGGLKG